jgi:hypothetical protein
MQDAHVPGFRRRRPSKKPPLAALYSMRAIIAASLARKSN